jgi:hypothetical protein
VERLRKLERDMPKRLISTYMESPSHGRGRRFNPYSAHHRKPHFIGTSELSRLPACDVSKREHDTSRPGISGVCPRQFTAPLPEVNRDLAGPPELKKLI